MELSIGITGITDIQKQLQRMERNSPAAAAFVLRRMGYSAREGVQKEIPHIFKSPTPWARKSIYHWPASTKRLSSIVEIGWGARNSLYHHVTGGQRKQIRFEKQLQQRGIMPPGYKYAVPAHRMKRNKYGNVTQGQRNKMLSAMGAQTDKYANSTSRSVGRNASQGRIFAVKKGIGTPPGIYRAIGSKNNGRLLPMMIFSKSAGYRKRWNFHDQAMKYAYARFNDAAGRAMDKYFK